MQPLLRPLVKKYSPAQESDLVGLSKAFLEIKKFVSGFKKGKALMIYGPTGSGKTSSVYAIAHELGLELIEFNASDSRNAASVESFVSAASRQMSLFAAGKVILVDEADGLSGREDRGGVSSLVEVVEHSAFPIIVTCQDPYSEKLKPLRKKCALLGLPARQQPEVIGFLKNVCRGEKIIFDDDALSVIARHSDGDLRAALNDLQMLSAGRQRVTRIDAESLSGRNKTENIESALLRIFKTTDPAVAKAALENVDEDLDELFLWVDENLPREYLKPEDLARGFDALSMADVFKGRILRWQHYRFYVYCYELLSSGVAVAKAEKYKGVVEYKETSRKLKIWIANMKAQKKKAIAEKIAAKTHTSKKQALTQTLPYLRIIFRKNKMQAVKIAQYLDLDSEQSEYLYS
jgi:replication factor C large subunit